MSRRIAQCLLLNVQRSGREGRKTERKKHIGFELRLIHNLIDTRMKRQCEDEGFCLTQLQHWILHYLDRNQGKDTFQRDLEDELHVSRATISSTLQVMERNGLISRTAVDWDARLKKISLTKRSLEFTGRAEERVVQMEELLAQGMNESERETLIELLRRVRKNLEEGKLQ